MTHTHKIKTSYTTLICVHEKHSRMNPPQTETFFLSMAIFIISLHPMITYTHPIAGNLPIKLLLYTRRLKTKLIHTHMHTCAHIHNTRTHKYDSVISKISNTVRVCV